MKLVLIWSVYALAIGAPWFPIGLLILVTLVTLSNRPVACEMVPVGACAEMSLPLPITKGRGAIFGGIGIFGGVMHCATCQSLCGYTAVKQPLLGAAFSD